METITLWTAHSRDFQVDDPNLVIDPTQGQFWKDSQTLADFIYDKALSELDRYLSETHPRYRSKFQYLWCTTTQGVFESYQGNVRYEWELHVPIPQSLFLDAFVWKDIVYSKQSDWQDVIWSRAARRLWLDARAGSEVDALLFLPLDPSWIRGRTRIPIKYP